jgi:hypothetical protein
MLGAFMEKNLRKGEKTMKTTRNLITALLLVAAMLIGAVLVPATFAASEPIDEPYDVEVYASTATTNAPLPETVESLTIVDPSDATQIHYLEDVVTRFEEAHTYGWWNNNSLIETVDIEAVWNLIVASAIRCEDLGNMPGSDFGIDVIYVYPEYERYETFDVSISAKLVAYKVCQDGKLVHQEILRIPDETMEQIVEACVINVAPECPDHSIELTDSIVGNLVWMAETKGFTVGGLSYDDICNVVYEKGNYYQSAMEIAATISVGYMASEHTLFYLGQAMRAETWEGMRENLIIAIERYAVSTMQYSQEYSNGSLASQLVADSFSENWYELDTMDIFHYALCMSVVAGGCY